VEFRVCAVSGRLKAELRTDLGQAFFPTHLTRLRESVVASHSSNILLDKQFDHMYRQRRRQEKLQATPSMIRRPRSI
jgi:hypothetical protein